MRDSHSCVQPVSPLCRNYYENTVTLNHGVGRGPEDHFLVQGRETTLS